MMTTPTRRAQDTLKRARWVQNSLHSWILKTCFKDGSAVLATVTEKPLSYDWEAAGTAGSHISLYGAFIMARKALREAGDGHGNH